MYNITAKSINHTYKSEENKLTISKLHPPRIKNYTEYPTKTIKMPYHACMHAYDNRIRKKS